MLQSGGQQTTAFRERRRLGSSSYVSKKLFFGDRFFLVTNSGWGCLWLPINRCCYISINIYILWTNSFKNPQWFLNHEPDWNNITFFNSPPFDAGMDLGVSGRISIGQRSERRESLIQLYVWSLRFFIRYAEYLIGLFCWYFQYNIDCKNYNDQAYSRLRDFARHHRCQIKDSLKTLTPCTRVWATLTKIVRY